MITSQENYNLEFSCIPVSLEANLVEIYKDWGHLLMKMSQGGRSWGSLVLPGKMSHKNFPLMLKSGTRSRCSNDWIPVHIRLTHQFINHAKVYSDHTIFLHHPTQCHGISKSICVWSNFRYLFSGSFFFFFFKIMNHIRIQMCQNGSILGSQMSVWKKNGRSFKI